MPWTSPLESRPEDNARLSTESQLRAAKPGNHFIKQIVSLLDDEIKPLCAGLGLSPAEEKISSTVSYLRSSSTDLSLIDWSSLEAELRNLIEVLKNEYSRIWFIGIAATMSGHVDNRNLLGETIPARFPEAVEDIESAGNCLAVELPTAAVFHLMRVVEWGLRAFAADLGLFGVSTGSKDNKTIPIEWAEWDRILNQLSDKIRSKIESIPKGPKRQQAQEFYFSAKQEVEAFKDAWRNHVMHARRRYSSEDAIAALSHVGRFMKSLVDNGMGKIPEEDNSYDQS